MTESFVVSGVKHNAPTDLDKSGTGWQLDHWEVMGANGQYCTWWDTSTTITQYINWHTWPEGWINVPYGKTTHSVKAVFVPNCCGMGPLD